MIVGMERGWFATIRRLMEDTLKAHLQLACPTLACRLTKEFRNSVTFYLLPQGFKLVPCWFSTFRNYEVWVRSADFGDACRSDLSSRILCEMPCLIYTCGLP